MASTQSVSKDDPVVSVNWLNVKLKDPNMKLPHMLPLEEAFAAAVSALAER